MKIALISPIEETVPPKKYGGTEWVVYSLAKGLSQKKHKVYLFASGDCQRLGDYKIIPIYPYSIRNKPPFKEDQKSREAAKFISLFNAFKIISQEDFDIVHNHTGWRFLLFQNLTPKKFLTTLHTPMSYSYQNLIFEKHKSSFYISISDNQRKDFPHLNYLKTIYNGIDINEFTFKEDSGQDYLLFFARFSPEKGPIEAIKTAIKTNKKLIICSKVDKVDESFFNKNKDLLNNNNIYFYSEVSVEKRASYYQNAKALIAPINWEEPFGLMFTEAMATGTPVITFARGSVPEIIKDGETGFIVNQSNKDIRGNWIIKKSGVDGLCEAVERIYSMPKKEYQKMRQACRHHVEKHFTFEIMVNEYEKVYRDILDKYNKA